jgi:acetyl esterase
MALHPQAVMVLDMLASMGNPPIEAQSPDEVRAQFAAGRMPSTTEVAKVWDVASDESGLATALRCYHPRPGTVTGATVYLHGGGWVIGDLDSHDQLCRDLAVQSGHAVISVDYRLAPEHPYPAALGDTIAALRWVHANAEELGVDADRLAVAGDSAGANLAAVAACMDVVTLRYQVLLYPVTDARCATASHERFGEGRLLTNAAMRWFTEQYLAGDQGSPEDPRVSPLLSPLTALASSPPTLVITAGEDPLLDEGEAYAHRLLEAGVATSLVRFDGMIHGFISLGAMLDDTRRAVGMISATLAEALAG